MPTPVTTSVIVPTFNGEKKIGRMADLVLPLMVPGREFIVIDDGSRDGTATLLRRRLAGHPHVLWRSTTNQGRANSRNAGVEMAQGELIVFLDDDIEVSPGFLDRMEAVHRRFPSAWITGTVRQKIIDLPHADFLRFRARLDYVVQADASEDGLVRVPSFTTQQLGVSREIFLKLGGFRRDLKDVEDSELSLRVMDAGYDILHDTKNVVLHADFADFDQLIRRQKEYVQGIMSLLQQEPELSGRFPKLFFQPHRGAAERAVRQILNYNPIWRILLNGRFRKILPEPLRHQLYDYVMSSTVIKYNETAMRTLSDGGM